MACCSHMATDHEVPATAGRTTLNGCHDSTVGVEAAAGEPFALMIGRSCMLDVAVPVEVSCCLLRMTDVGIRSKPPERCHRCTPERNAAHSIEEYKAWFLQDVAPKIVELSTVTWPFRCAQQRARGSSSRNMILCDVAATVRLESSPAGVPVPTDRYSCC